MEQIRHFSVFCNAKNNTEYVFLSIFYPIFASPGLNFSGWNEIKAKNCNSGPICKYKVYMNFPGLGEIWIFQVDFHTIRRTK